MEYFERWAWLTSIIISIVAIALIGMSSQGALNGVVPSPPTWFLNLIPHINAALVLFAPVSLLLGYRAIRRNEVRRHALLMGVTSVFFFTFLTLYLLRLANQGLTEFPGNQAAYNLIYLPFLALHMTLASVSIPLVVYLLIVGYSQPTPVIRKSMHPRVGRIAVPLWGTSFIFGFVVYILLHHVSLAI